MKPGKQLRMLTVELKKPWHASQPLGLFWLHTVWCCYNAYMRQCAIEQLGMSTVATVVTAVMRTSGSALDGLILLSFLFL